MAHCSRVVRCAGHIQGWVLVLKSDTVLRAICPSADDPLEVDREKNCDNGIKPMFVRKTCHQGSCREDNVHIFPAKPFSVQTWVLSHYHGLPWSRFFSRSTSSGSSALVITVFNPSTLNQNDYGYWIFLLAIMVWSRALGIGNIPLPTLGQQFFFVYLWFYCIWYDALIKNHPHYIYRGLRPIVVV